MGLTCGAWESILDGCLSMPSSRQESTPTLLRTFNYLPNPGTAEQHPDLGLLILCVGLGKGLQVLVRVRNMFSSAQWIDVKGATLLVRQVLRTLSGNRLRTGLHRVAAHPGGRQSIVFALRPLLRHDHADLALYGGEGTLSMSELWAEIRASRFNVNTQEKSQAEQKEHMRLKRNKGNEHGSVSTSSHCSSSTGTPCSYGYTYCA